MYMNHLYIVQKNIGTIALLSPYGSTPNGSCSRDVGVWPDGELCTADVGGVNAVDALGNGANDGTSAENPLRGEEKFDFV
jgi:hypothetical protein